MTDERRVEVVMSWGGSPQAAEVVPAGKELVIGGDAPGITFLLPAETMPDAFVLVGHASTGPVLRVPAGAEARAQLGEEDLPIPQSDGDVRTLALPIGSRAEVKVGEFTFFVTTLDQLPEKPMAGGPDWRSQRWLLASFAVHATLLAMFFFMPPNAGALSFDMTDSDTRYIRASLDALALEEMAVPEPEEVGEESSATSGEPMTGDEGAAGAPDETRATGGQVRVRGESTDTRVPLTASDVASSSAIGTISSVLMASMASSISSPYGAADAMGAFDQDAYGSLMADAAGFSAGGGGFGMRGTGRGAGGLADGTIGWGGIGSGTGSGGCTALEFQSLSGRIGHDAAVTQCASGSRGHGVGTGLPVGGDRHARVPGPISTHVETTGGLTMEEVRRVVARQRGQIRFCYEQGLASRPDLAGRVSVRWVVSPDGHVASAGIDTTHTDIRAAQVESCVSQAVSRWTFPASDGPTAVTYPFVLQTHE
jgi:hypothetical protein